MQINHTIRSLFLAIAVLSVAALAFAPPAAAQLSISVSFGPPALPIYEQPPCPQEGFLWTPGYWAYDYDDADYYWVPGTWVEAPEVGFLWTPGYWGWGGEGFLFHEGYWGQEVGFYGGISYGFGYFGEGYEGGRWDHDRFFYNRSVNNVNVTNIHNVYNTTVINNTTTVNRVSYNGGNGGVAARPTPQQEAVASQRHIPPVAVQTQHMQAARSDPQQRASVNQGKPAIAATPKAGELHNSAAVPAKQAGAPYQPPANRGKAQPNNPQQNNQQFRPPQNSQQNNGQAVQPGNSTPRPNPMHASELPPRERPAPQSTGNPKLDQKYQQQQQKLAAQQDKEQQKLQQRQEQDHQRLAQQNADEAKKQQVEQKHQQQTQQLQQKYEQQQQKIQQRQRPPNSDPARPPQ